MTLNLNFSAPIYGEGKYLYIVTHVDTDDSEDTTVQMWLSNSEEELCETIMEDIIGDTDLTEEELKQIRERYDFEMWGQTILIKKIAEVA
jgi:hypothetical protein